MPNAQEYINEKYPNKEEVREINGYRKEITDELIIADFPQVEEISVGNNQLTQLHLKNCPQLIELYCGNSKLTELTITNCPNLQKIYAPDNQLTNLDLSNNQKLKILRISNNNFSSNLSFCHHLVNLKELYLGDNNFTGSLEPLRNLSKLEALSINNNTNLNQGLEFFPDNARNYTSFSCEGTIFKKQLKPYGGYYRGVIKKWRAAQNSFWGGQEAREKDAQIKIAFYTQLVNELRTSATTNEAEKNNRIKELEKKQSEIEQEFRKNQQTIYKHLKDCATILFNSNNSCDNPSNLSLAYLEEEAEKVKQGCRESKNHNQELANQNHDLTTQLIAREKNVQSLQEQLWNKEEEYQKATVRMAKKNEEQLQKKEKEAIVIKQENQITQSKIWEIVNQQKILTNILFPNTSPSELANIDFERLQKQAEEIMERCRLGFWLENEENKLLNQKLAVKNQEITELKIALENRQAEKLEAKIEISPN